MNEDKVQVLKAVTRHHCDRLREGSLFIKDCALVHIAPSETIMVNNRLWDKPGHMSFEEYFKSLGGSFFEDSKALPYVIIPWNKAAECLNTALRNAWRFNFDVEYKNPHELNSFLIYDVPVLKEIWSNLIRHYRNRALNELDLEFQVALEKGETEGVEEIGVIRQMLRDLPEEMNLDQYTTAVDILSFWPTILLPAPDFVLGSQYVDPAPAPRDGE